MQHLEDKQLDCVSLIQKLLVNYKKCAKDRLTKGYNETRLEMLESYWRGFQETHNSLVEYTADEKRKSLYFTQDTYDSCMELYLELKTRIKEHLDKLDEIKNTASAPAVIEESVEQSAFPTTKLPPIKLPTFSGDYRDWLSFHDLFKSLVHDNPKVSKVNKCQHLKSSLQGEAESLVKQIQVSEANYDIIWSILNKRYNNKRSIVNNYLGKLLHQKKVTQESSKQIRELLDTTTECLATLKSLELPTESWDDLVVFTVIEKLDPESHKMFEQRIESTDILPTWMELSNFLEFRFRTLESVKTKEAPMRYSAPRSYAAEFSPQHKCVYCKGKHLIYQCKEFAELELITRKDYVQKNQLCFNCLRKGHPVVKCIQSTNCRKCGRKHHTLLHGYTTPIATAETVATAVHSTADNFNESTRVLLATALVKVRDETGHNTHTLRALVDPGSQASLITEAACQTLGLRRSHTKGSVIGVGASQTATRGLVEFEARSTYNPKMTARVRAYVMKSLTSYLPQHSHQIDWPILRGLELADPMFYETGKIDLLLGADVHAEILEQGLIKHKSENNTLIAQKTTLGWLISGKNTTNQSEHRVYINHVNVETDTILRRFWELEDNTVERTLTRSEIQCEELYTREHIKVEGGPYRVRLPFTTRPPDLGESLTPATKQLAALEKRLDKNTELRTRYNEFIDDYIEQKHMELVPESERKENNQVYYLPHHAVINEQHLTTRLRAVFNGSCKTTNNKSLNDNLHIGPPLQSDLRDVTLRWRQHPVVLVGDIRQMFRKIEVDPRDRDYQRILWRSNTSEPIQHYRLTTVTYGTACAPYLAIRTLKQVAIDQKDNFPEETVRTVLEDFYVDDLLTGSTTEAKVIELRDQVIDLLSRGGFTLHKWASNRNIQEIEQSTRTILGIKWDGHTDKFEIRIELPPMNKEITKRAVLCDIARIYDPNGWLAPAVIVAKSMLQKLWKEKIDWDDTLPEHLLQEWVTFRQELTAMPTVYLDRWLGMTEDTIRVELHGFSDASTIAYSAVVYCRVITPTEITVTLIESKTRVAPVKQISVPRLELCGAVLLAKLIQRVQTGLKIPPENVHAWTDATIVLAWLQKSPSYWTTFVANRVTEITNIIERERWHHVPTQDNPADVASRGISPLELPSHPLWWQGPTWIRETTAQPDEQHQQTVDSTDLERKLTTKDIRVHTSEVINRDIKCKDNELFDRYSTLNKLIRVVARMMRFFTNLKSKLKTKNYLKLPEYLCTTELKLVMQKLILISQRNNFVKEINIITDSTKTGNQKFVELKKLPNGGKIARLNPFIDRENILRVGGRLHFSEQSDDVKHPIILTNNCKLAQLIVKDAHSKTLHGGVQLMINYIRNKFHVIGLKNLVKKVIPECVSCRRHSAKLSEQLMGNLPKDRVNPQRPFIVSGVDMAGPITLKLFSGRGSNKTQKGYIAVFVCTAVKAIHLELVTSLSSEGFLAAFRRFTSRRGHCQKLISDCGTNFIGCSKELKDMFKISTNNLPVEIANLLAKDGTEWQFNPAGAPHQGGLWEAAVKSVKHHLNRVLNDTKLTYEEYSTLLCQVEACLNSRPLTPCEGEDGTLETLTPGHFLIGEIPITVPEQSLETVKVPYTKRWIYLQQKLQSFWRKWSQEYLVNLQKRYKWTSVQDNLKIGDVVLIKDERLPPAKWLLGKILDTHPGTDGLIRVVTLKCNNSTIKRPIHKLCSLM